MKTDEDIIESSCQVKIFRLVTGEAIISAVEENYMYCPFAIVQISQQGHLGFNPYCVFGQTFEKLEKFKDVHVITEYDADEELIDKYKPAVLETIQKIRAQRAGLVLDTNVSGAQATADKVSQFRPLKKH